MKDGICSICKRLISNGCSDGGILIQHPAVDVDINVEKPGWKKEFNPICHTTCEGSGTASELSQSPDISIPELWLG